MTRRILIAALALLPLTGCLRRHAFVHHGPHGTAVAVQKSHSHSAHCGHYRVGGSWYHQKYHTHGHGCGHSHVGGVWTLGH